MRISDFGRIGYGKESEDTDAASRKDIIYRVYLSDRQVWEVTDLDEIPNLVATNTIVTKWQIEKDFNLNNVTGVTSIIGTIDWGDQSYEEWRSGNIYRHNYVTEGIYDISFTCDSYFSQASFGRIQEVNSSSEEYRNSLIGVTLGIIPFDTHRLDTNNIGVFEGVTTIQEVNVPIGITNIPQRIFYNTSIKKLELPDTLTTIGNYAFVSNVIESIKVPASVVNFGTKCLGFSTNGYVVSNLKFYCEEGSAAATYAQQNGITPIYL